MAQTSMNFATTDNMIVGVVVVLDRGPKKWCNEVTFATSASWVAKAS